MISVSESSPTVSFTIFALRVQPERKFSYARTNNSGDERKSKIECVERISSDCQTRKKKHEHESIGWAPGQAPWGKHALTNDLRNLK